MAIAFPVGCLMKKSCKFLLLPVFLDLCCTANPINFHFSSLLIKIRFFFQLKRTYKIHNIDSE